MQGQHDYSALFQPGNIGKLQLKNRIIMAPMGNALADDNGFVTEAMLYYYRARAKGGAGMITTQCVSISRQDMMPYSLSLHDDSCIPGMKKLVETIHEHDSKACIQLMHPGLLLLLIPSLPKEMTVKIPSLSPLLTGSMPYETLDKAAIQKITNDFAQTAGRAVEAGFDALEVHACHGCLLSTFLSPVTNHREDEYGGTVENRARFTREVITSIRETVGVSFPITVRINASDDVPGGVTPGEVLQQAVIFNDAGIDAISISSGLEYWSTLMAPPYTAPEGVNLAITKEIKNHVSIPVITAGKINPELASNTVSDNTADFIALGRPLLADPELPNKLRSSKIDEIRQCLYCNNCLRTAWRSCSQNAFLFRENLLPLQQTTGVKQVIVVGGGIAGMQAALLLHEKGHRVTLYEKESKTGGQWLIAAAMPGKQTYRHLIDYLRNRLVVNGIPCFIGVDVTPNMILAEKPDVVVIATGAKPQELNLPGMSISNAVQANDVITGKAKVTGRIVVIGSNLLGMEIAAMLAEEGKSVQLVSRGKLGGRKGPDDEILYRALLRKLVEKGVPCYPNVQLLEAIPGTLRIQQEHEILSLPADTIITAIGVVPVVELAEQLQEHQLEVYTIGDCVIPGNASQAIFSAARLAIELQ